MKVNYKPDDGWAADFIPFFWKGEYHLFYLKDFRDVPGHGEGTPWNHLVTRDFVNFTDFGECLSRGSVEDQDLYVFTGSVIYGEGKFHIFYTGHNPHFRRIGKPEQAIMHAVSNDLYNWVKVPEDTFFAPTDRFEPHDWRDPFVFWNETSKEYWMLVAARQVEGPSRRRGCTGLCTSKDLRHWEVQQPFYAPALFFTHECPDLFQIGDWWYLLFSEFSEAHVTRYRMARSLDGPWTTPEVDTFDGRAFYAAKTTTNGTQRYLIGWNPTRADNQDYKPWHWGGNLVVHEIDQRADGTLSVHIPDSVNRYFDHRQRVRFTKAWNTTVPEKNAFTLHGSHTFMKVLAGKMPERCKIEASIHFTGLSRAFGMVLRASEDFENAYYIRLEPQNQRLVLDTWPRPGDIPHMVELERKISINSEHPIKMIVYVNANLCEVYIDDQVALSARLYNHPQGNWGFFVQEACAEFFNINLYTPAR